MNEVVEAMTEVCDSISAFIDWQIKNALEKNSYKSYIQIPLYNMIKEAMKEAVKKNIQEGGEIE